MRETPFERFKSRCREDLSGCILWTGAISSGGYGRLPFGASKYVSAHRWLWEKLNGPIPKLLCVLHSCDVRHCVNPLHLRLGTHADNSRDMVNRKRGSLGERHHNAKLTEIRAKRVIAMIASGAHRREIAAKFNISVANVTAISQCKAWKHLPRPDMSKKRRGDTKLLPLDVASIRTRIANGERGSALAREYGVSDGAISLIKTGKTHRPPFAATP